MLDNKLGNLSNEELQELIRTLEIKNKKRKDGIKQHETSKF